jgi:molybdopterin synthase sulfur carrier subunit
LARLPPLRPLHREAKEKELPTVVFTSHLRNVAPQESFESDAATVGGALESVWRSHPRLRGYVMDDQGALRRHIAVFLDGKLLKSALTTPVRGDSQIHVMQALSGG